MGNSSQSKLSSKFQSQQHKQEIEQIQQQQYSQMDTQNIEVAKLMQYATNYYLNENQFYPYNLLSPYHMKQTSKHFAAQKIQFETISINFMNRCRVFIQKKKIKKRKTFQNDIRNTKELNKIVNDFSFITQKIDELSRNSKSELQNIINSEQPVQNYQENLHQQHQQIISGGIDQFQNYDQEEQNKQIKRNKTGQYLKKKYGSMNEIQERSYEDTILSKQEYPKLTVDKVIQLQNLQKQIIELEEQFLGLTQKEFNFINEIKNIELKIQEPAQFFAKLSNNKKTKPYSFGIALTIQDNFK